MNYYDILGVARDASHEEIQSGYRERVKEVHPDVSSHKYARKRFRCVKEAYFVLAEDRSRYDRIRHKEYVRRNVETPAVPPDEYGEIWEDYSRTYSEGTRDSRDGAEVTPPEDPHQQWKDLHERIQMANEGDGGATFDRASPYDATYRVEQTSNGRGTFLGQFRKGFISLSRDSPWLIVGILFATASGIKQSLTKIHFGIPFVILWVLYGFDALGINGSVENFPLAVITGAGTVLILVLAPRIWISGWTFVAVLLFGYSINIWMNQGVTSDFHSMMKTTAFCTVVFVGVPALLYGVITTEWE